MVKNQSKYMKLQGKIINNIKINEVLPPQKYKGMYMCNCTCHCGKVFITRAYSFSDKRNIKSCGCLAIKAGADAVRGKPAINRLPDCLADKRDLFKRYKKNALIRNLEFNIDFNLFEKLLKQNCYFCDSEPYTIFSAKRKGNKEKLVYNGIDRLNSKIGYIESNIVTCCQQCNYAKSDYTVNQFKNWIKKVYKHLIKV